jgi:hypothetical protein
MTMTDLTDRITEVLRHHECWRSWGETSEGLWCPGCKRRYPEDRFAAHVAERIAEALPPTLSPSLLEQLQPEGSDLLIQKANSDNLDWTWRVRYCNGTTGQSDTRTGSSLHELLSGWAAGEKESTE